MCFQFSIIIIYNITGCIKQIRHISVFIYHTLDKNAVAWAVAWAVTWAVALYISKVFDRIRHANFFFCKLKCSGISVLIFELIQFFLTNYVMNVIVNGYDSKTFQINVVASWAPIHGATLFIINC